MEVTEAQEPKKANLGDQQWTDEEEVVARTAWEPNQAGIKSREPGLWDGRPSLGMLWG